MINLILFFSIVFLAVVAKVYTMRMNGSNGATSASSPTPNSTGSGTYVSNAKAWILAKVKANWKTVARVTAILVGCHFLAWYFWPGLWWNLAKTPVFWLDHAILILAFLFLREGTGSKKKFVAGTGWLLAILVFGNVWTVWDLGQSYYTTARAKAVAERQKAMAAKETAQESLPTEYIAPVGRFGEKIPNTYGTVVSPHGPILLQTDKELVELEDIAVKSTMAPLTRPAKWMRFQSRTSEPVKVTVSR